MIGLLWACGSTVDHPPAVRLPEGLPWSCELVGEWVCDAGDVRLIVARESKGGLMKGPVVLHPVADCVERELTFENKTRVQRQCTWNRWLFSASVVVEDDRRKPDRERAREPLPEVRLERREAACVEATGRPCSG